MAVRSIGGKPSTQLLDGNAGWKVTYYEAEKAKKTLFDESGKPDASNDELFHLAMRNVHGTKDTRIDDFNGLYAFSRVILTLALLSSILLATQYYRDWRFYAVAVPLIVAAWVRFRERGFYFAREVLNEYLKQKSRKAEKDSVTTA